MAQGMRLTAHPAVRETLSATQAQDLVLNGEEKK